MIKVKLRKEGNIIKKIIITGHANYAEYGKDIVCAAVSATVLTTLNGIIALDNSILEVEEKQDKLVIDINKIEDVSQILINNMINCLEQLVIEYPKNIKIEI